MSRLAQKLVSERLTAKKGPEMGIKELPYWLQFTDLLFAEDPPKEGDEVEEEEEEEDEDEEDDKPEAKKITPEDVAGLKSALATERARAKKAEREAKALRKFKDTEEDKGKTEVQRATDAEAKSSARSVRLAAGFLTKAIDLEVTKAATKLGFADIDDAISLVKRAEIKAEQDEDDPSEVEIDAATVKVALETLLKNKPHLKAKSGTDEEDEEEEEPGEKRTGSKVGSREKRGTGNMSDAKLKELYPFLR